MTTTYIICLRYIKKKITICSISMYYYYCRETTPTQGRSSFRNHSYVVTEDKDIYLINFGFQIVALKHILWRPIEGNLEKTTNQCLAWTQYIYLIQRNLKALSQYFLGDTLDRPRPPSTQNSFCNHKIFFL